MEFKYVLVAVEESEFAAHALEVASSLATASGAQIGLIHVIDPKFVGSETGPPAHPQCWKFLREGTPWSAIVDVSLPRQRRRDLSAAGGRRNGRHPGTRA